VERRLSPKEIFDQLKIIVDSEAPSDMEIPVGIMTSMKRPAWADQRTKLLAEEINKQSLEEIETCHFIVNLDEPLPAKRFNSALNLTSADCIQIKSNGRDETNIMHQMLHGGGSNFNTGNRWFDKTIQVKSQTFY
jgi:choline O-acetyltransferase